MAVSLRDKLRSAAPLASKPKSPKSQDCMLRQHCYAPADQYLPKHLPSEVLKLMQGVDIPTLDREEILFLDTETTGLSGGAGTVAFLVGVGYFEGDELHVKQYMMRDYDEEAYVLEKVAEHMQKRRVLCTFNGVTFDLPLLKSRCIMQRIRLPEPAWHIDLLHASRRVWKLRLKKCNLTALEEAVLGRTRVDDLPGALVPERYFRYLREKDMSLLEDVLEHNQQDIASLADILRKLLSLHESPLEAGFAEDIYSLGRIYEKRGQLEGARKCYRAASKGKTLWVSQTRLAETLRKTGDYVQAAQALENALCVKRSDINTHIALAKLYEHRIRDLKAALSHTKQALLLGADIEGMDLAPIQKRYERIMLKLRRMD